MSIHIKNYDSGTPPSGETYDSARLIAAFTVEGFSAPYVFVTRKSDGQRGTLEFTHSPRIYFGFKADR